VAKGYIRRNYEQIREQSSQPKQGFDPIWIKKKIYSEIDTAFSIDIIQEAIDQTKQSVHKFKKKERLRRKKRDKKKKSKRRVQTSEMCIQTDLGMEESKPEKL